MLNQCKKFAKPELKSCIEEFEEKLNKIHMEKKEQEVTARNAQVHQQKLGTLQGLMKTKNSSEEMDTNADSAEGNHFKDYALSI